MKLSVILADDTKNSSHNIKATRLCMCLWLLILIIDIEMFGGAAFGSWQLKITFFANITLQMFHRETRIGLRFDLADDW